MHKRTTWKETNIFGQLEEQSVKKKLLQTHELIIHQRNWGTCAHLNWCHFVIWQRQWAPQLVFQGFPWKTLGGLPTHEHWAVSQRPPPTPPPPSHPPPPCRLPFSRHQVRVITNTLLQPSSSKKNPTKNPRPGWYSLHFSPRSSRFPTAAGSAMSWRVIKPDWALRTWLGSRYEARQQRDESGWGERRRRGAGRESGMKDRKTETGCLSFSKAAFTSTLPPAFCRRQRVRGWFCRWIHHRRLATHTSSAIGNIACGSIYVQKGWASSIGHCEQNKNHHSCRNCSKF